MKIVMFAVSWERLVGVSRQMFRQTGSGNTAKGAEGGSWRIRGWRQARGARPEGVSQEVARWKFLGGWVGGWTALLSQAPISILPSPYPQVLATIICGLEDYANLFIGLLVPTPLLTVHSP